MKPISGGGTNPSFVNPGPSNPENPGGTPLFSYSPQIANPIIPTTAAAAPTAAVPTPSDASTQADMAAAAADQRRARGRAATLLTGGQGDLDSASLSKRTLLGN